MIQKACYWRPVSTNLLTDEDFRYVEDNLPPDQKTAPYMFYLACLQQADDDGMVDLEDGEIFSRLMRVGAPLDVFKVANLFMKRKIIHRIGETTCCLICDWSYPGEKVPRTLEQRRASVQRKIEAAEKRKAEAHQFVDQVKKEPDCIAFSLRPENDKNDENVVKTVYDDKNQKNVVSTEREIDRKIDTYTTVDINKDTHTQSNTTESDTRDREQDTTPDQLERSGYGPEEDKTITETLREARESEAPQPGELLQVIQNSKCRKDQEAACFDVLQAFFANKCQLYNPLTYTNEVNELVRRIKQVASEDNPPDIIAKVLTQEFFRLSQTEHWYNLPLTPDYLLKPAIWSRVISLSGKVLAHKSSGKIWEREAERARNELAEDEKKNGPISDQIDKQYRSMGIDPTAPNATDLFLQAISRKNREKANAEETKPP